MKILVVCQYYYPESFLINEIAPMLQKNGHEVTVLTGLPNYPQGVVPKEYRFFKKRNETVNGVRVIRCAEIGRRNGAAFLLLNYASFALSASLKALFMREKFDLVFSYQLSPITMALPEIKTCSVISMVITSRMERPIARKIPNCSSRERIERIQ